jgi:Zn-dependent protease
MIRGIRSGLRTFGDPDKGLFIPLLGLPVRINYSFWPIATVASLQRSVSLATFLEWLAALLVSILLHELGHALVASRWAVVLRINIHGAGGETSWTSLQPLAWERRLAIILAGPLAGLLLGLVLYLLPTPSEGLVGLVVRDLLWINVGWGLFNLVPAAPLDGGEAMKTILVQLVPRRAEVIAASLGVIAALVGAIVAIGVAQPWAVLVLGICGFQNFETLWDRFANRSRSRWQTSSDRDRDRY